MKKLIILILVCLLLTSIVQALDITNMMTVMNQHSGKPDWIRGTNQSNENFTFNIITGNGSGIYSIPASGIADVWVNLSGDTMTGNLDMGDNNITDVNTLNPTGNLSLGGVCYIDNTNNRVGIGTASPDYLTELYGDGGALGMSVSGVAHGLTGISGLQTDTYFRVKDITDNNGGALVYGLSDEASTSGMQLQGIIGVTNPTDATPAITLVGSKKSTTDTQVLGDTETVIEIRNRGTSLARWLGDGTVEFNGNNLTEINSLIGNSDNVRIGNAGTDTHSLTADDDLFVSGKLEVDGYTYFDTESWYAGTKHINDNIETRRGDSDDVTLKWSTVQAPDSLIWGLGSESNAMIIAEKGDDDFNFAHPLQNNPTMFIQSATQSTSEWGSLSHDTENFMLDSGTNVTEVVTEFEVNDDATIEGDLIIGADVSEIDLMTIESNGTNILYDSSNGFTHTFTGANITTEYADTKGWVTQYHRNATINSTSADTWVNITWDLTIAEETTAGYNLTDSNVSIQITEAGIYRIQGCLHPKNNGAGTQDATVYSRILINNVEARCLQYANSKAFKTTEISTMPFIGTIHVNADEKVQLQYRVSTTDIDFEGSNVFDDGVAGSINFERMTR